MPSIIALIATPIIVAIAILMMILIVLIIVVVAVTILYPMIELRPPRSSQRLELLDVGDPLKHGRTVALRVAALQALPG